MPGYDVTAETAEALVGADAGSDAGGVTATLDTLTAAHMTVLLAGRSVRVPGTPAADVRHALDAAGIPGRVSEVPSTLDETLITLMQSASDADSSGEGSG